MLCVYSVYRQTLPTQSWSRCKGLLGKHCRHQAQVTTPEQNGVVHITSTWLDSIYRDNDLAIETN